MCQRCEGHLERLAFALIVYGACTGPHVVAQLRAIDVPGGHPTAILAPIVIPGQFASAA